MRHLLFLTVFTLPLLIENVAHAYVGPGLGLGVIGAFVGVVVAVLLAIVGAVWYPIKRMFRKLKANKTDQKKETPKVKRDA